MTEVDTGIRSKALWHPDARRVIYANAGSFVLARPKLLWHTTETPTMPTATFGAHVDEVVLLGPGHVPLGGDGKALDMDAAGRAAVAVLDGAKWRYSGSAPHFTLDPGNGDLQQHMPINTAAMALRNPSGGVETNRAHVIQVELIGYAKNTGDWPARYYDEIAELARWIERNAGVPRECDVRFGVGVPRLAGSSWIGYAGHCGHEHAPENDHWDPGAFRIAEVLDQRADAHRTLKVGMSGPDVSAFQRAVTKRANGCCRPDRRVSVDGDYGPETRDNGAWAAWILGVGESQDEIKDGGVSAYVQRLVRDPDERNDTQRARAGDRRARHCRC